MAKVSTTAAPSLAQMINYGRYSRIVFYLVPHTLQQVLRWLYKGGTKSFYDFLRSQPGELEDFDDRKSEALKNELDPSKMDASMVYKLLRRTCGLDRRSYMWHSRPKLRKALTLEQALHEMKEVRNILAHTDPEKFLCITSEELDSHIAELTTLSTHVLILAGMAGKIPEGEIALAVGKATHELWQGRCLELDIGSQQLYTETSVDVKHFVQLSREELLAAKFDQNDSTYVAPRLLTRASPCTGEATVVPLRRLLCCTCHPDKQSRVILVSGGTGAGKSALCRYLLNLWAWEEYSEPEYPDQYDLVLWVRCDRVNTRDVHRLIGTHILPCAAGHLDAAGLTRLLHSLRVLWLIDGGDDGTADARALLTELLETQAENHTILVTTRPEQLSALTADIPPFNSCITYSIAGLDYDERRQLFHMAMAGENKKSPNKLRKALEQYEEYFKEDLKSPKKFLLWCYVLEQQSATFSSEDPISWTKSYMAMKDASTQWITDKFRHKVAPGVNVDLEVQKWLEQLSKVAFDCVGKSVLALPDTAVDNLKRCSSHYALSSYCLSVFLNQVPLPDNADTTNCKYQYRFSHQKQLQFFVALHLSHIISKHPEPETYLKHIIMSQPGNYYEFNFPIEELLDEFEGFWDHAAYGHWEYFRGFFQRLRNILQKPILDIRWHRVLHTLMGLKANGSSEVSVSLRCLEDLSYSDIDLNYHHLLFHEDHPLQELKCNEESYCKQIEKIRLRN